MDQLLSLVVRSNASPNSWLVVVVLPAGALFWLITSFHGGGVCCGLVLCGSFPICSVSTA